MGVVELGFIKEDKGLTIVELVIVIAMLGILTSVCIPKNKIKDYRLHSQALTLTNDIRMIRYLMMTEGESYYISFSYTDYYVMNSLKIVKNVKLGDNIWMGNNMTNNVRFSYNGSPKKAGSIMMKDTTTNKRYDITIVPYTGRVLLTEYHENF